MVLWVKTEQKPAPPVILFLLKTKKYYCDAFEWNLGVFYLKDNGFINMEILEGVAYFENMEGEKRKDVDRWLILEKDIYYFCVSDIKLVINKQTKTKPQTRNCTHVSHLFFLFSSLFMFLAYFPYLSFSVCVCLSLSPHTHTRTCIHTYIYIYIHIYIYIYIYLLE